MKNENLSSLVGRVVNVYKGGPEANKGLLLAVNDDFIVLQTEDGETIYYALEHVKSISEDSQARFSSLLSNSLENQANVQVPKNAQELLQSLKNERIRVNRGGPESRVGTLVDVKNDYFTLYTDEGITFYKKHHVKSLSKSSEETNDTSQGNLPVVSQALQRISANTFSGLLQNLQYSWVEINSNGPDSVKGMLIDSNDQFVMLADKEDLLRVPVFHIKSLRLPMKNARSFFQNQNQNKNEQDDREKSNGQNSGNSQESNQVDEEQVVAITFVNNNQQKQRKKNGRQVRAANQASSKAKKRK